MFNRKFVVTLSIIGVMFLFLAAGTVLADIYISGSSRNNLFQKKTSDKELLLSDDDETRLRHVHNTFQVSNVGYTYQKAGEIKVFNPDGNDVSVMMNYVELTTSSAPEDIGGPVGYTYVIKVVDKDTNSIIYEGEPPACRTSFRLNHLQEKTFEVYARSKYGIVTGDPATYNFDLRFMGGIII